MRRHGRPPDPARRLLPPHGDRQRAHARGLARALPPGSRAAADHARARAGAGRLAAGLDPALPAAPRVPAGRLRASRVGRRGAVRHPPARARARRGAALAGALRRALRRRAVAPAGPHAPAVGDPPRAAPGGRDRRAADEDPPRAGRRQVGAGGRTAAARPRPTDARAARRRTHGSLARGLARRGSRWRRWWTPAPSRCGRSAAPRARPARPAASAARCAARRWRSARTSRAPRRPRSSTTRSGRGARSSATRSRSRDLLEVKRAHDVSLNDVALAVVAGALRRLSLLRHVVPAPLKVMVPVSRRGAGEEAAMGNRIAFVFITLPVDVARPARAAEGHPR